MHNPHNDIHKDVTGVILAGGSSQRMGVDKATLKVDSHTLFEGVKTVMTSLFERVLIAGERPDLADKTVVSHNDIYRGSSLGGLHNAFSAAKTEWVCVLPCDLPFPSKSLLKALLQNRNDTQAVVPLHTNGAEPLVACYRTDCLPLIEEQLSANDLRLTNFLAKLDIRYLTPTELPPGWQRALTNLNTPEDIARLTQPPPAITVVARSGTGKTTLLEKLITALTARGWTIGALKHDAHRFEIDHEDKDSWRLTNAGASVTTISSEFKSATVRKHDFEPDIESIILRDFTDVDLVLTEGFKASKLPKIEIHRASLNQPLLCRGEKNDPTLIAVASDHDLNIDVPVFSLNKTNELVEFIEREYLL